jgi:hypothetical protein
MILPCILTARHQHTSMLGFLCVYFCTSLLTGISEILFVFYGIYVIPQRICIIRINQNLMCPIQYQSHLVFVDLPNGVL